MEDLISEEDVVVTLSHGGYAKAQPVTDYQAQRRGGRGRAATRVKEEDFVDKLFIANTHDWLLCFSSRGKVYWLKVYELPLAGPRLARQADRQPAAARERRAHQRGAAGARVHRGAVRVHGDQPRHGQEDAAGRVLAAAHATASSPSTCATTTT
jgi:hypothetical protein